eukprot:s9351_g3.t1
MGAQSTATTAQGGERGEAAEPRGFLDMDGETIESRPDVVQAAAPRPVQDAGHRHPDAQLNGVARTPSRTDSRSSRVGTLLSEVSAAVQNVVGKASAAARVPQRTATPGAGSAGTVGTTGTSYITAASEEDVGEVGVVSDESVPQGPLFSAEQAERLETLARAAPLLYPEAKRYHIQRVLDLEMRFSWKFVVSCSNS